MMMRSSFNPDNNLYCATLWQCTITIIHYGLIGDIFDKIVSHPMDSSFKKFGFFVIFHLSFFIFITTIGLNIIFGIIVDTFSELRDLKWTAERDMRDTCFICSRGSYDFEHHGMGFEHHINNEHNIWAYIFFFIHLHDTKQCDYTSLELYVFRLLAQEKFDFFPLNRALSLSVMDEGSTDSKVDDLLRYVLTLVERQKEEDAKNKREEERKKQLRWREENRNALLHPDAGSDAQAADNSSQSNQSQLNNSIGQLLRQKRWQRDIKDTKLVQSIDTQDSAFTTDHRAAGTTSRTIDILSGDETQTGYTKTSTLPFDTRVDGFSRRSSPLPGSGWAAAPQRSVFMSLEGRSDDAPVRSIEFDEEEDHRKSLSSPLDSHLKSLSTPYDSRAHTAGSSARLTPVDHYEHPPSLGRDTGAMATDSQHRLETDLRDVATKLLPEAARGASPSEYYGTASPGAREPLSYAPSDHSSGSEPGLTTSRPLPLARRGDDPQLADPRRMSMTGPQRESFQSVTGRRPQPRHGMDEFGLLTEDPFELTAPTAQFDEGLVLERRPAVRTPRDEFGPRSDSKPSNV